MKIYIINGANLNMLGIREKDVYGHKTYKELVSVIEKHCSYKGIECLVYQSNHEGDIVDMIQKAYFDGINGIVLNPGGYTHTSVSIADAVAAVSVPTVEVHLSEISAREEFRKTSFIKPHVIKSIEGKGFDGYIEAIDLLFNSLRNDKNE